MSSNVEQVKERLSIEEIVGQYVKLIPAGQNLKARCPFHSERTPSFIVSPGRQTYHCFGCGVGGDIFTFIEEMEGLDFRGALKVLADRAGVTLAYEPGAQKDEKDQLFDILEEATSFFVNNFKKNTAAREYLHGRGITDKTMQSFMLGFAQDSWDSVLSHLKDKAFTEKDIERAGLIKTRSTDSGQEGDKPVSPSASRGGGYYDRFRSRIMFPIADSAGRVVAFSGRIFGKEDTEGAKYINSPETSLYHKSKILYGYDRAKQSIRRNDFAILVEGQMDLVAVHQAGYTNTVALSGTALTPEQITLLSRMSKNLVIALDADNAGVLSAGKSARAALRSGFDVKVAELPVGSDPADLIQAQGADAWKRAVKESKHIIDFLLDLYAKNAKDSRALKLQVKKDVLPYLNDLQSEIDRTHFIQRISRHIGTSEEAVKMDLAQITISHEKENEGASVSTAGAGRLNSRGIMDQLMNIYVWQKELHKPMIDVPKLRKDVEAMVGKSEFEQTETTAKQSGDSPFSLEMLFENGEEIENAVQDLLARLEAKKLAEELGKASEALRLAETAGDIKRIQDCLRECDKIRSKMAAL
jgi:DNA primase